MIPTVNHPRTETGKLARERMTPMHWLMVSAVILGAVWLRWHLLDVPLERDEGEYAYGGQLLLQGVPPYQLLYNMKLPGIYAVYAAIIGIFGQTQTGVHLGLLVANVASILALVFFGARLAGPAVGVAAAGVFAVLSVGQAVQGVFANAEHFVLVPALAGAAVLLVGLDAKQNRFILLSGFVLGVGVVIKQHGVFFALWAGLLIIADGLSDRCRPQQWIRSLVFFAVGLVLPYGATCLLLLKAGVFSQFWFWTIAYAKAYAAQTPWNQAWHGLQNRASGLAAASPLVWGTVLLGIVGCGLSRRGVRRPGVILGFFLFSFLAVCPGLYFRPHYFVLLLPAAALLSGCAIVGVARLLAGREERAGMMAAVLLAVALGVTLFQQRRFLFQMTPAQASSDTYWPNPFNESVQLAQFIRENSEPSDAIAIIGSEPQIFFYSGRRSATGYIYMYPLMESHEFALEMQRRLIAEVEQSSPEYLLFVRIDTSWLQRPDSYTLIYDWFTGYKEGYRRVGVVEIFEQTTRFSWYGESVWPPQSPYWIEVLRKKKSADGEGA